MVSRIPVKEIMTRDVITADEKMDAQAASTKMLNNNIGSLVILNEKGKPSGILTERDLVRKVISKDLSPSEVRVKEIMTKPLITIKPNLGLNEAVRKMRNLEIKKLPVVSENKLRGILTESDVLTISPALNEVFEEVSEINRENPFSGQDNWTDTGICQNCGTYSEDLKAISGNLLCEQCRDELELEE